MVADEGSSGPGAFAVLLRGHRLRRRFTQEELAERAGISSRSVGEMERGRSPRARTVELLAAALELAGDERERFIESGRVLFWASRIGGDRSDRNRTEKQAVAPAQLPADVADFTGREQQVAVAVRALGEGVGGAPKVCVVAGAPGVGKTVFAVHVAHRMLPRFADCQLFATLRGADVMPARPSEVLAGFLRALGVDHRVMPDDLDERAALFRTLLSRRRALIVLDNVLNEEQVRHLLPGSAGCAVLVTSRRRLAGLGAQTLIGLDPFSEPESVELLGRIVGADQVAEETASAREVVRLCGGLPLALRIAGARLASRPHHRLRELAAHLADEHRRLDVLSYSDLAVRASFDLSHQVLGEPERRLLRRLAALDVPDIPLWLAAAVVGGDRAEVEESMERLIESHWVQVIGRDRAGQIRYGMHDLVRAYGRERSADNEPGVDAVRTAARHLIGLATAAREADRGLEYQVRLAGEIGSDVDPEVVAVHARQGIGWLEAESGTISGLVGQTLTLGLFDECWAIALAGSWISAIPSSTAEYGSLLSTARQAAERSGDRRAEGACTSLLGDLQMFRGQVREADALFDTAERIFTDMGESHGLVEVRKSRAMLDRRRGRYDEATRRYLWIRQVAPRVGDDLAESMALRGLAQIHLAEGRPAEALPFLEAALTVASRSQMSWRRLTVLLYFGEAYRLLGRFEEAGTTFSSVAAALSGIGDRAGEAHARLGLGQLAIDSGGYEEADAQLTLAAELAATNQERHVHSQIQLAIAEVRLRTEQPAEAMRIVEGTMPTITMMGAAPLLAQAEDILRRAGEPAPSRLADPASQRRSAQQTRK
ncbi:tetratricopeptide repeat protein [Microbispora sp. RL4-1S]|uniref:Tetratricopeptide repeat protein n=1 Tax=Microbispora oryzae TaxID=2806554 RepID=A0A941AIJ5_9ACTN|nr:helix-turn-helix domain-containing protein [Microbispora oryzae]MBP2703198.1 tetratricopeptide repeat protein [Microbispora oryzae]